MAAGQTLRSSEQADVVENNRALVAAARLLANLALRCALNERVHSNTTCRSLSGIPHVRKGLGGPESAARAQAKVDAEEGAKEAACGGVRKRV